MNCEIVERDLDAYVDRELNAASALELRAHVIGCTACRRRVAEREAVRQLVKSAPYFSAPDRLRSQVSRQGATTSARRRMATWAAAAALVVAVGGGIALVRTNSSRSDAIAVAVVDGHLRSLMGDHLFDVRSTDQHTVKPWFLGKLDFSPPVIDLAANGFPLVGGRLDYLDGRPAAALVYQRHQHTINLFVAPATDGVLSATAAHTDRGFHVHHWVRGGMAFWAVSDVNDAELTQFVQAIQASPS